MFRQKWNDHSPFRSLLARRDGVKLRVRSAFHLRFKLELLDKDPIVVQWYNSPSGRLAGGYARRKGDCRCFYLRSLPRRRMWVIYCYGNGHIFPLSAV